MMIGFAISGHWKSTEGCRDFPPGFQGASPSAVLEQLVKLIPSSFNGVGSKLSDRWLPRGELGDNSAVTSTLRTCVFFDLHLKREGL